MNRASFSIAVIALASCLAGCPEAVESARQCETPGTGCGPFYFEPFAPLVANCFTLTCGGESVITCFSCPCNVHDACYDDCGNIRGDCDEQFMNDMMDVCGKLGDTCDLGACTDRAFVYGALVWLAGEPSFQQGQRDCEDDAKTRAAPSWLDHVPSVDDDFDFMPDEWERAVGLDPEDPSDAFEDSDADGKRNIEEYLANTDPFGAIAK